MSVYEQVAQSIGLPVVNLGLATADVSLAIGQTGFIDFSNVATVALNVATKNNEQYEIILLGGMPSGSSGDSIELAPNNLYYAGEFTYTYYAGTGTVNAMRLAHAAGIAGATAYVTTNKNDKRMSCFQSGLSNTTAYGSSIGNTWNNGTIDWFSLGSLATTLGGLMSGRVIVKRLL